MKNVSRATISPMIPSDLPEFSWDHDLGDVGAGKAGEDGEL